MSTIFSQIIAGEVPAHRVYEDDHVLAFLDANPISKGHMLLIPKEPAATIDQLSDGSAAALGRVLPRLCRALLKATGTREFNILQNNGAAAHQAIPHVHFHLIPKYTDGAGLLITWQALSLNEEKAEELAGTIRRYLHDERRKL
jgi:histidine triad (HIT) family protein